MKTSLIPKGKTGEAKPRQYRIYLTGGGYVDREAGLSAEATVREQERMKEINQ